MNCLVYCWAAFIHTEIEMEMYLMSHWNSPINQLRSSMEGCRLLAGFGSSTYLVLDHLDVSLIKYIFDCLLVVLSKELVMQCALEMRELTVPMVDETVDDSTSVLCCAVYQNIRCLIPNTSSSAVLSPLLLMMMTMTLMLMTSLSALLLLRRSMSLTALSKMTLLTFTERLWLTSVCFVFVLQTLIQATSLVDTQRH